MAQPTLAPVPVAADLGRVRRAWTALPVVVRYGVVGGVTQVVYLSVLGAALALGAHYLVGLAAAQLSAIAFAFPAYRGLVFAAEGPLGRQFATFLGVWWTGAALSLVGVPLCVEAFGLHPFVAQLLVLVVVVGFSFLGHLRVTFRRPGA
ncbi:GtrA family protein [Phycicoccus sonneratiae]|uniref:GtrA family protein n=1 Tax=Phycicoccus sonneratiae TaxID=2807628 RepID=A0ABS2CM32_9MICO|nr:GtrA family protein [Phycicoccus sonneraticus]MBM6400936.1 GtrA family protein [Phycicoccus sonneraticus]